MNNILQLKKIGFSFSHLNRVILHKMSNEVSEGDFIVLLGSNGSGKSTLLKLIDQRYMPTQGEIIFCEHPLKHYKYHHLMKDIVTLTQNAQESLFTHLTVLENCLLICETKHKAAYFADYLSSFNSKLSHHLNNLAGELSGGEQQALALALACLQEPKLLLLDEHTSALDPHASEKLMQLTADMVQKYNMTCILTTHNLDIATNYGNRLIALQDGKVVCDYRHDAKAKLSKSDIKALCYDVCDS